MRLNQGRPSEMSIKDELLSARAVAENMRLGWRGEPSGLNLIVKHIDRVLKELEREALTQTEQR